MSADLGEYWYFRMRINPSLTTADGGSSFILTSVPSSRQILWLLVTVAMQRQQRKVWGVLVTAWNELAMCVWGWEVWGVRGGDYNSTNWLGWGDRTHSALAEEKKTKRRRGRRRKAQAGHWQKEKKRRKKSSGWSDMALTFSESTLTHSWCVTAWHRWGGGKKSEGDVGDGQGNRGSV